MNIKSYSYDNYEDFSKAICTTFPEVDFMDLFPKELGSYKMDLFSNKNELKNYLQNRFDREGKAYIVLMGSLVTFKSNSDLLVLLLPEACADFKEVHLGGVFNA